MLVTTALNVPAQIRRYVDGAEWEPVAIGESRASVFRLRTRAGILFLKMGAASQISGLRAEKERLEWLAGRVAVPEVIAFAMEDDGEFLLLSSLPGANGVEAGHVHPKEITAGLAHALKRFHIQFVERCPFDQSVNAQVRRARQRIAKGLVDESDFDDERIGWSAAEVLAQVIASRPDHEARVITHGDPCLPNVIFAGAEFAGFVDCGRAGVADPYQDLALAARSITFNLGASWVEGFFREYGIAEPDERKLAFYRLLDELF